MYVDVCDFIKYEYLQDYFSETCSKLFWSDSIVVHQCIAIPGPMIGIN